MIFHAFKIIFFLGIVILPLFFWPSSDIPFEIPKVTLINRWIEMLAILLLFSIPKLKKKQNMDLLVVSLLIIFIIASLISSYLGVDFDKSFWGNFYRNDGLLTFFHLAGLSLIVGIFWNKKYIKLLAYSISFSAVIASVITVFLGLCNSIFKLPNIPNWDGAIAFTFGNPNFLAGYLLTSFPFLLYIFQESKNKKLWGNLIIIQILAILFTKAFAGILGILLLLAGYLAIRKAKLLKIILPISIISILIAIVIYVSWISSLESVTHIVAGSRIRILAKATLAVKQKPLLGWGWANFDYAFDSTDWPLPIHNDVYVDKAHSHFLEILVTTGILGLFIYTLLNIKVGYNLYKLARKSLFYKFVFLSFALYLIHSQINVLSISQELVYWIIVGLAMES